MAWVFNLDAEDELARLGPDGSTKSHHTPTKEIVARVEAVLPALRALMQPDDEIVWPSRPTKLRARVGRAWCPTTFAFRQMTRAKLQAPPAPPMAVLRRVNHRRFAHELGQALPGARFVSTEAELLEALADTRSLERTSRERNWLMKRPRYAGRGRLPKNQVGLAEHGRPNAGRRGAANR